MYDVIIVGAGPGGASAAYTLGEAGYRVLVLEKEQLPRYKACGGGFSPAMLEKYFPFSFEPVIENQVSQIAYQLGKQVKSVPLPDRSMALVMRDQFDLFLLKHAKVEVETGAAVQQIEELEDSVRVETRNGRTYQSRFLIGSDGASSVAAKSIGLSKHKILAAAIEAETPVSAEVLQRFCSAPLFIFGEIHPGYLWVFPKADHLSVGVAALHPKPGQLQTTLRRVMDRYHILVDGVPLHGYPLPIYTGRKPVNTRRVLLVEDAAGLTDPFSGEGIRIAIKSGRLAAKAVLSGWIDHQIGASERLGLGLGQLFYTLPGICFELGVRNPLATQAVMDLLADRIGYRRVILRMFGTLPYSLFIRGAQRQLRPIAAEIRKRQPTP